MSTTTAPRFTAWAYCPRCRRYDVHKLREPRPAPSEADIEEWHSDRYDVRSWGSTKVVRTVPARPVDESAYEVVRICECGHEWGMT